MFRPCPTLAALLTLLLPAIAFAQGVIILPRPIGPGDRPPVPPPDIHIIAPPIVIHPGIELRSHQVQVDIRDQVATTRVEQVFYNPSAARVEGEFIFPLPKDAHLSRFSMDVNGKDTEAELLDAAKARQIYEDIVRRTKDPALLEFCDQGLLRARMFPIEPHSEKRVTLTYTHLLPGDGGLFHYAYPLTGRTVDGRPVTKLAFKATLETGSPITNVYCPSHAAEVNREGNRRATIGFESDAAAGAAFSLYFSTRQSAEPVSLDVLSFRDPDATGATGGDGFFMLLASPNVDKTIEPLPKEIVFVLDTSGSMSDQKLEQARRALLFCLDNLNEHDAFEIIRFATDVEPLFNGPAPADTEHLDRARAFVKGLKPMGGTATYDALKAAIDVPLNRSIRTRSIIFLTDGLPTIGNSDIEAIVSLAEKQDIWRVFCFGIGTDINTHLLDRITEVTKATSEYVLPEEDIEVKLSRFYTKIDSPVMTDLRLTIDPPAGADRAAALRISAVQPRDLLDLFVGEQLVVVGRYNAGGDALVRLTGKVDGEETTIQERVTLTDGDTSHAFLPRLWAMRRVGFLLDQIRLRGENSELRDEVVRLARDFGVVTPYTAYLIVEDEAQRGVPVPLASLGALREDPRQREEMRMYFETMARDQTGRGAVAGAKSNQVLREAEAADAYAGANEWAMQANGPVAAPAVAGQPPREPVVQATRYVAGRTFVQNGTQWIDTQAQQQQGATPRRVAFNSEAYFDLLRNHPEAAPWLSVSRHLLVVIGDELIEIVEES